MAWQARSALRRSFTVLAVGGLGLALPIIPVSLQNSRLAEQFVLIQATGGFNYYLGNRPAADGTPNVRVGPEWDRLQLLRFTAGGQRETDLPGGFYYRRAFDFARSEPLHFFALLLRKAALGLNAHEITASLPHIAFHPELARWPLIGFVWLLPLALVGLVCNNGSQRPPLWLPVLAIVLLQTFFLAAARYRVPMLPGVFALAGLGLTHLITHIPARRWQSLSRAAIPLCLGIVLALLPIVPNREHELAEAHQYRGLAYRLLDRPEDALREWRASLAATPDYATTLLAMANTCEHLDRPDQARAHLRQAVTAHPDYAAARVLLAETLLRQGAFAAAEPHFIHALKLNPENTRVRFLYGRALAVWDRWADAAEQFSFILERYPNDPDARWPLGVALVYLGDHLAAARLLESTAPLYPNNRRLLTALTRLRAASPDPQIRNPEQALLRAGRLVEITNSPSAEVADTVAMALAAAGNFGEALQFADTALRITQTSGDTKLRQEIAARRELYVQGIPYRDPPRNPRRP